MPFIFNTKFIGEGKQGSTQRTAQWHLNFWIGVHSRFQIVRLYIIWKAWRWNIVGFVCRECNILFRCIGEFDTYP